MSKAIFGLFVQAKDHTDRPSAGFVTGWGKVGDEASTQDAGFDLHLVKPVEEKQIVDILGALSSAGN